MVFVVKKTIKGKDYYYLNENKRVDGKVKTKSIAYLGKDRKEAEIKAKEIIDKIEGGEFKKDKRSERQSNIKNSEGNASKISREEKNDKILSIANTRGFFFNTASIYGGVAGFYTYGHLGKALKTNWENLWRGHYLNLDDNFYEIQSNNILPEPVFVASGHIENFNDPMAECKKCHSRVSADKFLEEQGIEDVGALSIEEMNNQIKKRGLKCPKCSGEFSEALQFNMMFPVTVGMGHNKAYLSPETAQGAYLAFKDEFFATRGKFPLGLAIIDKAYRNEISPRQGFFRLREFSQAELQIFFDPDKINEHPRWEEIKDKRLLVKFSGSNTVEDISCKDLNEKKDIPKFYVYYAARVQEFYLEMIKIPIGKFRFRELGEKERAFYNKIHFDIEVDLETLGGFKELGGIHYRTDHDLEGHQRISNKNLEINLEGKKFIPHVLELSFGGDRNVYSLLDIFFGVGKEGPMFNFPPLLSPVKAAIFPIIKKPEFEKIAEDVVRILKEEFEVFYDRSGSIGRRYARNDEVGTPYCITVDGDSIEGKDVTIRDRDTTKQIRVKISELKRILRELISGKIEFEKVGKIF